MRASEAFLFAGTCGNRTHLSPRERGDNGFEDRGGHQAPMHSRNENHAGSVATKFIKTLN